MRAFAIFAVLAVLTSLAAAQRAVPAHTAAPRSPAANSALSHKPHRAGPRRSSPYVSPYGSLPFPFLGDSFNPDDIYSSGYPVASPPPPFLMQAVQDMAGSVTGAMGTATSPLNNREPSSNQPLMIELQNGRYVRVDRAAIDGEARPLPMPSSSQPAKSARSRSAKPATSGSAAPIIAAASPVPPLPAVVLVFRDAHSEEVRDYTIADGVLYARGDFYTDGYWNKKIDLASLDLAQTLQANASRNVKFVLPSSPNEVITRF